MPPCASALPLEKLVGDFQHVIRRLQPVGWPFSGAWAVFPVRPFPESVPFFDDCSVLSPHGRFPSLEKWFIVHVFVFDALYLLMLAPYEFWVQQRVKKFLSLRQSSRACPASRWNYPYSLDRIESIPYWCHRSYVLAAKTFSCCRKVPCRSAALSRTCRGIRRCRLPGETDPSGCAWLRRFDGRRSPWAHRRKCVPCRSDRNRCPGWG